MNRSPSNRRRAPLALAALVVAALLQAPAEAAEPFDSKRVAKPAAEVREYWTAARMRAAEPLRADPGSGSGGVPIATRGGGGVPGYVPAAAPGERPGTLRSGSPQLTAAVRDSGNRKLIRDPSRQRYRAHGKVFFTIPSGPEAGDYVCSGTAVNSVSRSLVWTAGHCVFDAGESSEHANAYSTNFQFVPAYHRGDAPFGEWPATSLATTDQWATAANLRFDEGAATVARLAGRRLQRAVGARGIAFNQPRDQRLQAIGYPAQRPFDGRHEYRCGGRPTGTDSPQETRGPRPMQIRCDMTAGASGGGWIADGILVSVTSYSYSDGRYLYGPRMKRAAKRLYVAVSDGTAP